MLDIYRRSARFVLFWAATTAVIIAASYVFPFIDTSLVVDTISRAFQGSIDQISRREFAYALAGLFASIAVGLGFAFGLIHVLPVVLTLWRARRLVTAAQGSSSKRTDVRACFAVNFNGTRQELERNWLIGHDWIKFEETLFDTDSGKAIGNTVRPQAFFNSGIARERLSGLKMMNAVPGYFVGIGLLLTFIGLVFALYKAGAAAAAGDAERMAGEMGQLLQIATFKFSTSIAGLGASIFLSLLFRWYFIQIDGAFDRFNASLEGGLVYAAPQAISMDISRTLQDQLVQLKDITQGQFFARMGSEIAPRLNAAIVEAMAPMAEKIGSAVGSLTTNSQLAAVAESLRQTMEKANAEMDVALGTAAGGASAKLEAAMGAVMEKLDRQIIQIGDSIGAMQQAMGEQGDQARRHIEASVSHSVEVQKSLLADFQHVVQSLSDQLRAALEEALVSVGQRFAELSTSMRAIEGALTSQKVALEAASREARKTAQAFGESATSVRAATVPLVTVGDKFSGATEKLAASVQTTLETLSVAKEEVATLASSLSATNEKTGSFWSSFSAKFDEVDTALAKAVETLSRSTSDQQQRLEGHVREVDQGLAEAIEKLSPLLASLLESAEAIADSMQAAKSVRAAE